MLRRTFLTTTSCKVRIIFMAALLLVGTLAIWAEATAGRVSVAADMSAGAAGTEQGTKPLGSLLNVDGTLNRQGERRNTYPQEDARRPSRVAEW